MGIITNHRVDRKVNEYAISENMRKSVFIAFLVKNYKPTFVENVKRGFIAKRNISCSKVTDYWMSDMANSYGVSKGVCLEGLIRAYEHDKGLDLMK